MLTKVKLEPENLVLNRRWPYRKITHKSVLTLQKTPVLVLLTVKSGGFSMAKITRYICRVSAERFGSRHYWRLTKQYNHVAIISGNLQLISVPVGFVVNVAPWEKRAPAVVVRNYCRRTRRFTRGEIKAAYRDALKLCGVPSFWKKVLALF